MSSISGVGQSSFQIDGLGSGLNTSEIVDKLVAVEARPRVLLERRRDGFSDASKALGSIRSLVVALRSAASPLANLVDWGVLRATSSDEKVARVTAGSAGMTGSLTIEVKALASTDVRTSSGTITGNGVVVPPPGDGSANTITIGAGTASVAINVGGGTLDEVINAINARGDVGIRATKVGVGGGAWRLQLAATTPGAAGGITTLDGSAFSGAGGGFLATSTASDAVVRVGTPPNSYDVSSSSGTFKELLPGTTITATALGTTTITTETDASTVADRVQGLVDAYNKVVDEIAKQTKYDPSTKRGSPLTGNAVVRQFQQSLADALVGTTGQTSASGAGITLGRDGRLTLSRSDLLAALQADPAAVQRRFASVGTSKGAAARVMDAARRATDFSTGTLTTATSATDTIVRDLDGQIEAYNLRLDKRRINLRAQFTALETALAGMKSQSAWLAGQLAGLNQNR